MDINVDTYDFNAEKEIYTKEQAVTIVRNILKCGGNKEELIKMLRTPLVTISYNYQAAGVTFYYQRIVLFSICPG